MISSAVIRCALVSSLAIRPLLSRKMRSAMPAIAELWVMTTVVVPSSALYPGNGGENEAARFHV